MKNPIRTYVLSGALCGLLAASAASFALGPRGGDFDPARMMEHMSERLELTDVQQEEIEQIFAATRKQSVDDRKRLEELRDQLQTMRDEFDSGQAQTISDEIGAISARMAFSLAITQSQVYALLDEDQRKEYDQMLEARDKRREQGRDRWRGR
jgi:Spy/CpxP family protein refolding chaperone